MPRRCSSAARPSGIILSRPAVEAGERLGFLPGDMREKVDPYLRPLYDALYDMMPPDKVERGLQSGLIEVAPLAFMRGRTLADAVVILDEAQNTTSMQMKMFLTRLGENSKMIVTGDPSQIDLPPGQTSGLVEAIGLLGGIPRIAQIRFTSADVVRHPLVGRIVDAYDRAPRRGGVVVIVALRKAAPAQDIAVDVLIEAGEWPARAKLRALAERAIGAAADRACPDLAPGAEVSLLFTDDRHMRRLNLRYRGKDKPTNVLSLPAAPLLVGRFGPLLGDIVLAAETVRSEADAQELARERPPYPSDRPRFSAPDRP